MDRQSQAAVNWAIGIIVIALVALGVWWLATYEPSPGVPNTGTTTSMSY